MQTNKQDIVWIDRPGLLLPPWREIPLSNGVDVALVDEEDFELVSERKWHGQFAHGRKYKYAACNIRKTEAAKFGIVTKGIVTERDANGRLSMTRVTLHQLLMGRRPGFVVDHKNGNSLDCRRGNLRWATGRGNAANQGKRSGKSSIYKGVTRVKYGKWRAAGIRNGRFTHLGYFFDEVDAARAYDANARQEWGEYARPNFPV